MKQTMYIAGPMRGKPDYNRAAFNAAAKFLAEELGLHPINPVDIERTYPCVGEDGDVDEVRLEDLMLIEESYVRTCDAIYLLKGWESSDGAKRELAAYLSSHAPSMQVIIVQGCAACGALEQSGKVGE